MKTESIRPELFGEFESDNFTYNVPFAKHVSIKAAIVMKALLKMYRHVIEKHSDEFLEFDGKKWFYMTMDKVEEWTGLERKEQDTAIKKLIELGLLQKIQKGLPSKRYFWIDQQAYIDLRKEIFAQVVKQEAEKGDSKKVSRLSKRDKLDSSNGTNRNDPMEQVTKTITNTTTPFLIERVNDGASPSLTRKVDGKSLFSGKHKLTDEQQETLHWLKAQQIDTSESTLSWWAKNYTMLRLDEVIREAKKRNPSNLGGYVNSLLRAEAVVVSGRIELNAQFAQELKDSGWANLEIHQKYAKVMGGPSPIEIDFNMESLEFAKYIMDKFHTYGDN